MPKLTSADIQAKLADASQAAEGASVRLTQARRLAFASGDDSGPTADETAAQKTLERANADITRYEAALVDARREDATAALRTENAEKDAQDIALGDALDKAETAAAALATILRDYATTYGDYVSAAQAAFELIWTNPRCRKDCAPPRGDELVATELVRLTAGQAALPPGASTHVAQFFDPAKLPPISVPVATFAGVIRADLATAKAARG